MAYIGNDLRSNEDYKIIDDISSGFNGSATSFALQVGGATPVPFPKFEQQLLISVNGVIQEPDPTGSAGFKLSGTNIVFSSAPTNGHAFFGVIYAGADYVNAGGTFPDGSINFPSITFSADTNTGFTRTASGTVALISDGTKVAQFPTSQGSSGQALITDGGGNLSFGIPTNIVNANINASAAIDGSKISPTFTSTVNVTNTLPEIFLTDTNTSNARGRVNANGGGLLLGADNDNAAADSVISFAVDGSEKARIDSSGNVLIGRTNTTGIPSSGDELVVSSSGNMGITIQSTDSNYSNLYYVDSAGGNAAGYISYQHSIDSLQFATATSEAMRLDSSGRLLINTTTLSQGKTPMLEVKSDSNTSADFAGVFSSANGTSGMGISYSIIEAFNNTGNATIQLKTNGTDAVRIASNQNVGIGTTNPGQRLEVRQTAASHAIIAANRANSDTFAVALGNTSGGQGVVSVNNADLVFGRDFSGTFTERMRMRNDGGLTFNGDTAAANALNDYEEGTWTPTLTNTFAVGTSSGRVNVYRKIGKMVFFTFDIFKSASNMDINTNGDTIIGGLPFTPLSSFNSTMNVGIYLHDASGQVLNNYIDTTPQIVLHGSSRINNVRHLWGFGCYPVSD